MRSKSEERLLGQCLLIKFVLLFTHQLRNSCSFFIPFDSLYSFFKKWGEMSVGWNVRGVKCPWGEMSVGWNVRGLKCPWGEMSAGWNVRGVKCPRGDMSSGWNVFRVKCTGVKCPGVKCLRVEMSWHRILALSDDNCYLLVSGKGCKKILKAGPKDFDFASLNSLRPRNFLQICLGVLSVNFLRFWIIMPLFDNRCLFAWLSNCLYTAGRTKYPNPKYPRPKYPCPKYWRPKYPKSQNTQGWNSHTN